MTVTIADIKKAHQILDEAGFWEEYEECEEAFECFWEDNFESEED